MQYFYQPPLAVIPIIVLHAGAIIVGLVESVIVLEYIGLKFFTLQLTVSPRKIPVQ
jgi:hypothetical protein